MIVNQSLSVYIVLYWTIATNTVYSTRKYVSFSGVKGVFCQDGAIVFNMTRHTLLSCVYKCQSLQKCTNVDYYGTSQICIGCDDSVGPSNVSTEGQGWKRDGEKKIGGEKEDGKKEEANRNASDIEPYGSDCFDHVTTYNATEDGVYLIETPIGSRYSVYCLNSMHKVGSGWTVFLRRINESVPFNRTSQEYINGFGLSTGNHWRGLQFLYEMTDGRNTDIIVLSGWINERNQRVYYDDQVITNFTVGPPPGYRLSFGRVVTVSGGVFGLVSCVKESNNSVFSTRDKDLSGANCSSNSGNGGWWWNGVCYGNPNGIYSITEVEDKDSAYCYSPIRGSVYKIKEIILAFRKSGVFDYNIEHF